MALTPDQVAKCRAWATAPARHWQILNRAKWKYQFRGSVIVRYVEEVKMDEDMVRDMLVYLTSDDCLQDLETYNQELTPEGEYKPTKAWYEMSGKTAGGVRSVRLYHAMTSDPDENADGPYLVEDGCVSKVSLEYHWNEPSVPDVQPSSSGISYRINSISHDPDTDLYSYVIEKRERVQQDVAEYFTAKTAFADMSEEYHLGVRQNDVAITGQEASVGDGRLVRRKISKNSDCTSDVHNTIEQEIAVPVASESYHKSLTGMTRTVLNRNMPSKASADDLDIGESVENTETDGKRWNQRITKIVRTFLGHIADSCSKTIFHHRQGSTDIQGSDPGFTHVVEASGGVIHSKSVSRTTDGSYRIEDNTTTEKPVSSSTRVARMTLQGLSVRVENRHQSEPLPDPTKVGDSVSNAKTEGGLYNTVSESAGRNPAGKIAEDCTRNAFTHNHTVTKNESEIVDPEHVFEIGRIVDKSGRLTSNGTADNTERVTTAVPQTLKYRYARADGSIVNVVKYHNLPVGYFAEHPELNGSVGLSVSDSLNAFGLHDGQVTWMSDADYNGRRSSDLKFIKHGVKVPVYDVRFNKRTHKWQHHMWYVQMHWIRGDAYTDYVADEMRKDPNRITPGVMWVKKLSEYGDRDGNMLAEWQWIELVDGDGGDNQWHDCNADCKKLHKFKDTDPVLLREAAKEILSSGDMITNDTILGMRTEIQGLGDRIANKVNIGAGPF